MSVYVGSARIDEHGNAHGGVAGDQNKREVMEQPWYRHSLGWIVIRLINPAGRSSLVKAMKAACANNLIGYDQYNRDSLYSEAAKVGFNLALIKTSCETDCSALIRVCLAAAGIFIPITPRFTTNTMVNILQATGKFSILRDSKYTTKSDYLLAGDILVTRTTGHTVMVLNDGALAKPTAPTPVKLVAPFDLDDVPTLHLGDQGKAVAYMQALLVQHGALMPNSIKPTGAYGYDGDWAKETLIAFTNFQKTHKDLNGNPLEIDGKCGPLSWGALIGTPCKNK